MTNPTDLNPPAAPLVISIVTPSYQHAQYIERTLDSVLNQEYPALEYIVIDGGSSDGTLDILRSYERRCAQCFQWISEPDRGQADAINKGFARATGDIMGWLNSDDCYAPGALRAVNDFFQAHPEAMFVYGDALGIDQADQHYGVRLHTGKRAQYPESDAEVLIKRYDFLVQPACFWRASLWHSLGALDTELRYTMDYEYWMRAAARFPMHYLPVTLAHERLYGQAKTGSGGLPRIHEIEAVARRHGGSGLPRHYLAESAAYSLLEAGGQLRHGRVRAAGAAVKAAFAQHPPLIPLLRYLLIMGVWGQQSLPTAALWINRWRTRRQR